MNPITRWVLLAGGVAALAACDIVHPQAFNGENVNYRPILAQGKGQQTQSFNQSLAQGYADFARWEVEQGDYRDGKYNLDKARMASSGSDVQPVDPTRRNIKPEHRQDVVGAHDRLTKAFSGDTKTRVPGHAAAAQVYFDCWVEQVEEGHQPKHIEYCRNGFDNAMAQLAPRQAAAPAPAPQPQAAAPARPFLVFFDWDKADLNNSSQPTIDEIAKTINSGRPATIRLAGHADKSGPDPYNMSLSEKRVQTVMNALSQKGIRKDQVRVEYFGESRPLVPTADGVREAQNRRVEVTFQ
jgi:outer membrane protein OmpA-like peptidoglycan-associated protein